MQSMFLFIPLTVFCVNVHEMLFIFLLWKLLLSYHIICCHIFIAYWAKNVTSQNVEVAHAHGRFLRYLNGHVQGRIKHK